MKKLLKTLAFSAAVALVGASAFADYGWYDTSIDIGGIRCDYSTWSQGNGAPDTDLGKLSDLTVSGVEMKVWDDNNDRDGANMYFRLYGDNGQIGGDVDLWLGAATRIAGDHDFSISYTGTFDLADAFGVTLEEGKTYYLNMWAKTYKSGGQDYDNHWYNGSGDNFHTKFVYSAPKTYSLVESADDLVVGADYLVVSTVDGAASALKNEANGTAIGCLGLADAAIAGNTISTASDAIVWQLKPGNHKGQRLWYNEAAAVYAAAPASAGDNAQLLADGTDDLAQWTIDTSALPAVKVFSVSYADRYLQRDGTAGNAWFAAYDSAQATPRLYRVDSTEVQTVTFDPNGGTYYDDMLTMKYVKGRPYWGIWKPESREGYKFLGWYDKEDGSRVRNDMVVTEDDTREFQARWAEIQTVTFDANGGTLRGREELEVYRDGVYAGFAMPTRVGYAFLGWFNEAGQRVRNGDDVTADAERTLFAHWGQTVNFEGNGGTLRGRASLICDTAGVYAGFAMPTWDGHTFLGWFDENDQRVQNGEDVTDDASRTLWAHWRESAAAAPVAISSFSMSFRSRSAVRGTSEVTDVLDRAFTGVSGTSYSAWTNKTGTSGAVYAGQSAGGASTNPCIQLRSNNNNSGIVTTTSAGKVKKVTLVWNAQTTDTSRTVNIYGTNTTYTAATQLYNTSTQGKSLGSLKRGDATTVNGKLVSELEIDGDYEFIGLRSNSGALYLDSVSITWLVTTQDPTTPTVTLQASAEDIYVGEEVTFQATATNFTGDVEWVWYVGENSVSETSSTFTWTPTATNTYTIKAYAADLDNNQEAEASVTVTVNPQTLTLQASATTVEAGDQVTITGTPVGFSGDVTWTWTVNDVEDTTATTATYVLNATTVGSYVVEAMANYGTLQFAVSDPLTITANAPTVKYPITIDPDILQYATVTTTPAGEATENANVTVDVTPNAGYVLDVITVNGTGITGNSFSMPAAAVTVSATFTAIPTYTLVESADDVVVGADYLIVATGTGYTNAMKGALTTTSTKRLDVEDITTLSADGKSIATDSETIVWQLKPGNHKGQRVWYSATAQKFAAAPDTDNTGRAQLLDDGTEDVAQWTIDTSALPDVKIVSAAYTNRYLERNSGVNNKYFAFYASGQKHPQLFRADSTRLQTVTFDPNGGTYYDDMLTMKYVKGRPYWGIWRPADREGYKFLGWYDEQGTRIRNDMIVTEDDTRTLHAEWAAIQTVTFDANGGTLRGREELEVYRDGVYAGFAMPTRVGYAFLGWFGEDGQRVKIGDDVTADVERTLFAHWGQTVHFEGNGGTLRGRADLICDTAGVYAGFAMPTWDGHTFLGWFTEAGQRVRNGEDVTDDAERTLWAHWRENASPLSISGFSVASRSASAARDVRSGGEQVFNLCFETVAGFVYEVQWTSALDGDWTVLKRWTAEDGVSEVTVSMPSDSPCGFFRLAMFDEVE